MNGLYSKIVSHVAFPFHEKIKGHTTVKVRKELERSQWWGKKELHDLQIKRLRKLLIHASKYVPYYQGLFQKTGFKPEDISSLDELQQLPLLDKATIRENIEALKAVNAVGLAKFNTGGSSGEPLIFFIGKERVSHDVAAKWRATRWWDVDIGDSEIVVWGSPIEVGVQDFVRNARDRMFRTELLPAFEMSNETLDRFLKVIRSRRPKMLFGYPSALSHIARHAEQMGVSMGDLAIRVAFVTSERLYDNQREDIERVFNCSVANGYGGRDAGFIAHQCPSGGMHITAEDIIVEIVDSDGKVLPAGVAGEVVVTHLATTDFPFVRYRTGDVAVLDEASCSCGRGLPLLKEIHGRTTDFIVKNDGSVMHGLALIYILRDLPGIRSFQIVQESINLVRVLIVADTEYNVKIETRILDGMIERLGMGVEVKIECVDEIKPEKSGKYRYVKSRVAP